MMLNSPVEEAKMSISGTTSSDFAFQWYFETHDVRNKRL